MSRNEWLKTLHSESAESAVTLLCKAPAADAASIETAVQLTPYIASGKVEENRQVLRARPLLAQQAQAREFV